MHVNIIWLMWEGARAHICIFIHTHTHTHDHPEMFPNIYKTLPNKNASASVSASTVMTGISGLGGACNFSRISSDKVSGT